jgi:eukaryotic-like serine/threonine-protein kinase
MGLTTGTKLGPYEIQSPLGTGGMGEVYRARDTRLERTVAVKILPAQFSCDPVRKQRFEREAKTISSLNHPHICVLYDVGHQDGMDYLVMECVEGETLVKRLDKGPLPLDQVLKYGAQIADGLDKAHRSGVVHRDLKPGNIMLTPAGAKLLDFGLAKPTAAPVSAATLTAVQAAPVTEEGTIVGTFQYMSPEQVEGKEVDGRSDIFSLGAVLYEMVTGQRAFEGKSQLSVASAILEKEPAPVSAAKPMTPPALDHAVKKCLAKHPDERWQSASDLASQLKWIGETGSQAGEAGRVSAGHSRREAAAWLLAAALTVLLFGAGAAWWQASNRRPHAMFFHTSVPFAANDLALSPDGRTLAMVAYSELANNNVLWAYEVGGRRTSSLNGTQGGSFPFWSPDGKFIGFFADGKLKKVDVSGGQVQVLCDAPVGRGGTWNQDGVILFTPDGLGTGLFRVSSSGGSPVQVTKLDSSRFEQSHRWPLFLPDGKHFLYLAANFGGKFEYNAIFLGSLDSSERHLLVSTRAQAAYAEPGYLLYLRENKTLVAQPFDRRRYVLSGVPYPLSDDVLYFPQMYRAVFSISSGEVLVTQTGRGASISQLTWFDRSGKPAGTVGIPGSYFNVRLSPDGRRVAVDQTDLGGRSGDIWIHEPARGARTRLTFDPSSNVTPTWSPDGRQILFSSNRSLSSGGLYLKNADGSGPEEEVADTGADALLANVWDWSRDGKYILFAKGNELWSLSRPERVAKPLLQAKWTVRNAQFSPDGRWIAYASNETGGWEIYVSPFPSGVGKWQVSIAGGQEPRWRQDGKELFYVSAEGKMMALAVTAGAGFKADSPVALFQTHRRPPVSLPDAFSYDVSGDGQKFLILTKVDEANPAPLAITLNWASEMEK